MSTRQDVGVINVKYHSCKSSRTLNVTQTPAWLTQLSYPVDSKLYSDFCIARDCFMILMLRSFQFNALSRGNQHPNLPYKKACRSIFWGCSLHQLLSGTLLLGTGIDISLTTICMLQASIQNNCKHHIFSQ
jgi:hypothetical protein